MEIASAKRSGLYKIDDFGACVGFRKPEIQETTRASEMASAKGADSTKSTTVGLFCGEWPWKWLPQKERTLQNRRLWGFCGFPPFRRSKTLEIQEIHRGLGKGFRKRSGLYKIDSISAVPEAGNPGNLEGPWKWLPQKERTLQKP